MTITAARPMSELHHHSPHIVRIPAPAPWINSNQRQDLRAQTSTRRAWRDAGRIHAMSARLPKGITAVRVIATCHPVTNRRRDVGNLYPTAKAVVDGLVDYGLIVDDDDRHLIGPDMRPGMIVGKAVHPLGLMVLTIHAYPTLHIIE